MQASSRFNQLKFLILVLLVVLSWFLGKHLPLDTRAIEDFLRRFPWWLSGVLYIILYVVVSFFLWFSKDFFWLGGALVFGAVYSAILIWIGESINAVVLFHLARVLGRGFVESRLREKYSGLDKRLGKLSFLWLFIFRATPLVPYRFLDLGAGLSQLSFRRYLAAVTSGSIIKIFWLQQILAAVGRGIVYQPALLAAYFLKNKTLFAFSLIYLVLVALVALKLKHKE
jgi:uncharacterized membrane protein YdjX (TVP38/TMEM64 family)